MQRPICKRGHDTRITGRKAGGECNACRRERRKGTQPRRIPLTSEERKERKRAADLARYHAKRGSKPARVVKTHCLRGHDIAIVGRNTNGVCRECCREDNTTYRRDPNVLDRQLERYGRWGLWRNAYSHPVPLDKAVVRTVPDLDSGTPYQWLAAWEMVKQRLTESSIEVNEDANDLDYVSLRKIHARG